MTIENIEGFVDLSDYLEGLLYFMEDLVDW